MADPAVAAAIASLLLVPVGIVVARRHRAGGRAVLMASVLLAAVAVALFVIPPSG